MAMDGQPPATTQYKKYAVLRMDHQSVVFVDDTGARNQMLMDFFVECRPPHEELWATFNTTSTMAMTRDKRYMVERSMTYGNCYQVIDDKGSLKHISVHNFDNVSANPLIGNDNPVVAYISEDGSRINVVGDSGIIESGPMKNLSVDIAMLSEMKSWKPVYKNPKISMKLGSKQREFLIGKDIRVYDCGLGWLVIPYAALKIFLETRTQIIGFDAQPMTWEIRGDYYSRGDITMLVATYESLNR